MLREQEGGQGTADVCRRHGISPATFYQWKSKYGGLDVSEARRLKALEDENAKLNGIQEVSGSIPLSSTSVPCLFPAG